MKNDELRDLYQDVIIEHSKRPRNFHPLEHGRHVDGYNPLCGDTVTVYLDLEGDRVLDFDRGRGGLAGLGGFRGLGGLARGPLARGAVALLFAHVGRLLRITKPRVLRQDERLSPAVPPAFTTEVVHSWPR